MRGQAAFKVNDAYPTSAGCDRAKHGGHRALADITESINELAYYRAAVFVPPPGPDSQGAREIAARFGGVSGQATTGEDA